MTCGPSTRQLAAILLCLSSGWFSTGCAALNEGQGPTKDPFFSVADESGISRNKTFATDDEPASGEALSHTCRSGSLASK
jgi:hypothetical protein